MCVVGPDDRTVSADERFYIRVYIYESIYTSSTENIVNRGGD